MKTTTLYFCSLLMLFLVFSFQIEQSCAQAPQKMSYQAIIENAQGNPVANQNVGMRISILQGQINGAAVYVETHNPTTNSDGMVSLEVGAGTVVTGQFSSINWSTGPFFLKSETDISGGTNYSITGTSELLSVPYAFYSNNGAPTGGLDGQILTSCNGVPVWTYGGTCPGRLNALDCANATNVGTLLAGVSANGVSSSVPYNGGNGGPHNGQTVNSTGVSGLTATLTSGSFASGSGTLNYVITGTPANAGTASFALNIGGQTCTLNIPVNLPAGSITSLNCAGSVNQGTLTSGQPANGVSSSVPYSGGNGGTHNGQTVSSTGVTGLTATLTSGTFASGSGSLNYVISGTPANSGSARFALNIGGQSCTLLITTNALAGTVTSLNCSSAVNGGNLYSGVAASGATITLPYSGGNGGAHNGQTVSSTGVTGLTATLAPGSFVNGSGNLVYNITGTASGVGVANFLLSIGGQSCNLSRSVTLPPASITALNCASSNNSGTLTGGVAASGVSSSVPYTGGNGGTFGAQSVNSTGVTGLTATIPAGNILTGNGNITYTISGTPVTGGTASFLLSLGGQTCTLTRSIAFPAPAINLLDCAAATWSGTLTAGVQANGVSLTLPYSGGNGGSYNGQSVNSTGVAGLTATLSSGSLTTSSGNLVFNISGTPSGYGTATFSITFLGRSCTISRIVQSGSAQPCSGIPTVTFTYNGAQVTYGTVQGANNLCWMDRNLGASQVAVSSSDAASYGDLFQWGRAADGHQLRNSPITSNLSSSDQPFNGNYISISVTPFDWRSPQNNNLWQGVSGINNPCPSGWRVPTSAEFDAERGAWPQSNVQGAFTSPLKLPAAGNRSNTGVVSSAGTIGYYWASTISSTNSQYLLNSSTQSYTASRVRSYGHSVRCVRN
jgi:uncharacterized protein (TIGR02145 family)